MQLTGCLLVVSSAYIHVVSNLIWEHNSMHIVEYIQILLAGLPFLGDLTLLWEKHGSDFRPCWEHLSGACRTRFLAKGLLSSAMHA